MENEPLREFIIMVYEKKDGELQPIHRFDDVAAYSIQAGMKENITHTYHCNDLFLLYCENQLRKVNIDKLIQEKPVAKIAR